MRRLRDRASCITPGLHHSFTPFRSGIFGFCDEFRIPHSAFRTRVVRQLHHVVKVPVCVIAPDVQNVHLTVVAAGNWLEPLDAVELAFVGTIVGKAPPGNNFDRAIRPHNIPRQPNLAIAAAADLADQLMVRDGRRGFPAALSRRALRTGIGGTRDSTPAWRSGRGRDGCPRCCFFCPPVWRKGFTSAPARSLWLLAHSRLEGRMTWFIKRAARVCKTFLRGCRGKFKRRFVGGTKGDSVRGRIFRGYRASGGVEAGAGEALPRTGFGDDR